MLDVEGKGTLTQAVERLNPKLTAVQLVLLFCQLEFADGLLHLLTPLGWSRSSTQPIFAFPRMDMPIHEMKTFKLL